uniref:Reverse transcriptase domain-containing protein n=1 Tax=Tanacetum cinerariifolium TaxID=118510 RepID=A0A6L2JUV7_TANCI|nr:reverse transcriptase domain-containing protein [Tanacetum cinerariifolium]
MVEINKNLMRVLQVNQQVKAVTPNCCGGPHSFSDCPATVGNTQNVYAAGAYQVVEREIEATKDMVHPTNNRSTKDVQPSVVPTESLILNSEPVVSPIIKPVASPVSALSPNQRPLIPYPSRLQDQKLCDKANDQREKFFQIFKDLNFNISFADALFLMLKFGLSIKSLLTNKDKLCKLARTPLNEHYLTVLLKKLPEKLGDPGKFLIPYDFLGMAECLALADLGASINLMPLSMWNKLTLLDLSPTSDFVVIDFDADPRVPLILRRSFLKIRRALIDVFEGELTLRVGKEAITFNLDQTSRYSANYKDMTANRIDVIGMACEEYSQEVLGFFDVITSGNPTPYYDPIVSTTFPTLTPFENSDFFFEEVDAFLDLEDDLTLLKVDQSYLDSEGDILLLKAFLKDDPSLPPPNQGNYLPEVRKELKICKAKSDKSSIDEPLEAELKDLPPHLEYVFLEGNDKLPVIITKDLSMEEKTTLITRTSNQRFNIREESILKSMMSLNKSPGATSRKHFWPIHYASKTMAEAKSNYTTTEKEMLAVVYAFEKFRSYLIMNESIVYTDHSSLKYLFAKKDSKARLLRCILLLYEFTFKVIDTKGAENLVADHLSRLENPHQNVLDPKEINESFPLKTLNLVSTHATTYHPKKSGQVEVSNRGLKRILKRTVGENCASWLDKLDDTLRAFQTAYKTSIGYTPYQLVYGKACQLLIELEHKAYLALKHANFDLQTTGDHKKV